MTRAILNIILCWTGRQCKCLSNGFELEFHASCSPTRARSFWTRWSLPMFAFEVPYKRVTIIESRSDETEGDHLGRFESQTSANMSESTDVEVGGLYQRLHLCIWCSYSNTFIVFLGYYCMEFMGFRNYECPYILILKQTKWEKAGVSYGLTAFDAIDYQSI